MNYVLLYKTLAVTEEVENTATALQHSAERVYFSHKR